MLKRFTLFVLLVLSLLLLSACGGGSATPAATVKGNAENGKVLFS